ncbi:MAG: aspartate carbamoyltransferase [Gammaproteobacteria bacterium]|nr:aspartate carbamoyltransferase [Gammaproteobacteria bacterium]
MKRTPPTLLLGALLVCGLAAAGARAETASPERIGEVAAKGSHVMPFDLKKTAHVFAKTPTGGLQTVYARDPADTAQISLIRAHLIKIAGEFARGDFTDPERIHGPGMPGLAELRAAKQGQLTVVYKDRPDGGEITYTAADPGLVAALHRWFDAQVMDHGPDAMPGMPPEHHRMMHPQ